MDELISNRRAFGEALVELGRANLKVLVFDADVCTSTMTVLFRDSFPERFIEMGVAEQNMMCAAAGACTVDGYIPWVSTFALFASKRACDQVSISIAHPKSNVKINGCYGGIPTGRAGATHQSVQDIAIMRAMPNITVIVPVDAVEVRQAVFAATEHFDPAYLRTTRHDSRVILDRQSYGFEWARAVLLERGEDITIIGTGVMSVLALESAAELRKHGISVRVLHVHTLKPIDERAIVKAARETAGVVTVENHSVIGGLGSAVAEVLSELSPTPLKRIGFSDVFAESGDDEAVLVKMGLSVGNVVAAARKLLKRARAKRR
jgi:transketolase